MWAPFLIPTMPELACQVRRRLGNPKMKIISQILVVAIINLACTYSYAWVDSATTNIAVHKKAIAKIYRQQLLDLADRQEVIDQLIQYGVSREEAIHRINSLTDEEIAFFYENIDQLPTGGQTGGSGDWFAAFVLVILFFPFIIIELITGGLYLPPSPVLDPSQGGTCLEPCYSDFNDCMESSENSIEENQCGEEKITCVQQCEGDFN